MKTTGQGHLFCHKDGNPRQKLDPCRTSRIITPFELMESDLAIFWFLILSCSSGLIVAIARFRFEALGWICIYAGVILTSVLGWVLGKSGFIYAGLGLWLCLILLPGLLSRLFYKYFFQQRYMAAYRVVSLIKLLHPADGWREIPEMIRALALARAGRLPEATAILERFQGTRSRIGLSAIANLYRITGQWEELLRWQGGRLEQHPALLLYLLRAHAETGNRRALVELFARHRQRIGKLNPVVSRDLCRLVLFAFCGKREAVDRLLAGQLALLPPETREFWRATAEMTSGQTESAKWRLEKLLGTADPTLRVDVRRRLNQLELPAEPLDEETLQIVANAISDHGHDERFGATPSLFSRYARGTQVLILLNLSMFVAEIMRGGATDSETLYRLGGLYPPGVRAGEWWRLFAYLFLHAGPLHLTMNLFGLWVLGPFVEFGLGLRRFLTLYLVTGVSAGAIVTWLAGPGREEQLTVGASGSIMGLVGVMGALMLRGWLDERAHVAKRRLLAVLAIIGMQTVFDFMIPQVSMTGHLAGALTGFVVAMLFGYKLKGGETSRLEPIPRG